ncbi:MAG: hypothetical protein K6T66_03885 [Peptococcaceae bacterium]|nr:hypothetical protein [Peptococcaceae bacterium]
MSREVADLVAGKFGLEDEARRLLARNIRSLDRTERRYYFQRIKPMEKEIKKFLEGYCSGAGETVKEQVECYTLDSLLERRGDPDLVDGMVMDVVGRIKVYQKLRERSEREGIRLSALTNFGGLSMVLFAVVIITAIVLYLRNM